MLTFRPDCQYSRTVNTAGLSIPQHADVSAGLSIQRPKNTAPTTQGGRTYSERKPTAGSTDGQRTADRQQQPARIAAYRFHRFHRPALSPVQTPENRRLRPGGCPNPHNTHPHTHTHTLMPATTDVCSLVSWLARQMLMLQAVYIG